MAAAHKQSMVLALAALQDIISRGQAIQAATVRSEGQDRMAELRAEAHDILDAYLDHMTAAAVVARQLLD